MKRILTALVLIPIVVWIVLDGPQWLVLSVLAVVGLLAFHEFDAIAVAQGISASSWAGMAAGLAFLLSPEPLVTLIVLALALMTWSLRLKDLSHVLPSVAAALLGVVWIFGAWRCAVALREINAHWLMIALLVCWVGDTAAMYVGKSIGTRKLAPVVSPGKTWEGAIASGVAGPLAAIVYAHFLIPGASILEALLIGLAGNISGQIGDLCESAFKRGAGVKDSGASLPGHGGWLDRIDASLFSIPVVYAILALQIRV